MHPFSELIVNYNLKKIAEIGVLNAAMSMRVLSECPQIEEYYMIDHWHIYDNVRNSNKSESFEHWESMYRCVLKQAIGRKNMFVMRLDSVVAATLFPLGYLDAVYIDAGHKYEHVLADIGAWVPRVKDDGVLSGHDYTGSWPGVVQAVNVAILDFDEKTNRLDQGVWFCPLGTERKRSILENIEKAKNEIGIRKE